MTRPWHEKHAELVDAIRADLAAYCPTLHLFIEESGKVEIRGTFPVRSLDGVERDRYRISINLLSDYPESLPVVRETGGRIPWLSDCHVESNGVACVLIPDDRWRAFPKGAPFRQFLEGALHDYFLGQSLVAQGESWPFGQWSHGATGLLEYYMDLLKTTDEQVVARFVSLLARPLLNPRCDCPCGRAAKLRDCCVERMLDLRAKIPWSVAQKSKERMGITDPYKGRRLRLTCTPP